MHTFLKVIFFSLLSLTLQAQQPDIPKYISIIRTHIYNEYKGMFKEPKGNLKYPFITPGSSQYADQLWDWDSWLSDIALRQILLEKGNPKDLAEGLKYEQGCVLNFLSFGGFNGWLPHMVNPQSKSREEMMAGRNPFLNNMHKPCLAQHAAFLTKMNGGDASWLREDFYFLQAFVDCYTNHYRHKLTGLYYWQTDEGIGVDNDPSTFYRPDASSGSIFINALMYKELLAMVYLSKQLNQQEIANSFQKDADDLLISIRKYCWDPKDGFYYSVDLNLRPYEKPKQWWELHSGGPRNWECLIQRLGVWSGFLAMWAGIATPEQAALMVDKNFRDTSTFNAEYGIRSLSKLEKMYDLRASGNPSNWLGPIWINANYLTFRGLVKYGYRTEARELTEKIIRLIGKDFEKYGALHEYYLPDSGEPVLNRGFQNWNYLVLNMIAWYEGKDYVQEF
jgi:putative isomerase